MKSKINSGRITTIDGKEYDVELFVDVRELMARLAVRAIAQGESRATLVHGEVVVTVNEARKS